MEEKNILLSPLFSLLNSIAPMSNDLQCALSEAFKITAFPKDSLLLREGDICKNLWFLVDGLLRSFHEIGDKEITSRIMFTNHIVISPGSFFTQTACVESIEALTNSTVAVLSFIELQKIYAAFPLFNYHTRIITEQYFYKQEQRLYLLRKHDAVNKYKYFLEHYGEYSKNIAQKYIASFLNIAPETLSRIRKKITEKK